MIEMPAPGTSFGTYYCKSDGDKFWSICESEFSWYLHGYKEEPTNIELVADPDGEYIGWLDAEGKHEGRVYMVQHEKVFNIQFAYGYKAEEAAGKGLAVRLSARRIS